MSDAEQFAVDEMRVFSLLAKAGFAPETIYDIGASTGAWSALISQIFPDAAYHLFEPLATVLPTYEKGLTWQMGHHPKFRLHPIALGATTGTVTMRLHDDGYGSTTLNLPPHPEYEKVRRVPQYRLDEYMKQYELPLPEIIKLDTQGAERLILCDAATTLKYVSVVFAETWFTRGYGPETPLITELQEFLNEYDFDLVELGHRFYDATHRLYSCDAFFFKRSFAGRMVPLMPVDAW